MKTPQKTLMGKYYSVCSSIVLLSMVLERLLKAAFERGMRRVHHA